MTEKKVWIALAIALLVFVFSFILLVVSLTIPEEDENWRWNQPLASSIPPAVPAWEDLQYPFLFGPEPLTFETVLPPGEYAYALAEIAPIRGGSLFVRNESGNVIVEDHWYSSSALGLASYGLMLGFEGGLANFSFTGSGRALLLQLDPLFDLQDGSATIDVQGYLASYIPWTVIQQEREPASRLNMRWSSFNSMRITILDQDFHVLAESNGYSGDLELRSGTSSSIYYTVEGNGEMHIDLSYESRRISMLPVLFSIGSLIAVAVLGWIIKRKSIYRQVRDEPKKSHARKDSH